MQLRKLAIIAASTLVLTGCSFSLADEADKEPCQELSRVLADKLVSLPSGGFDAAALGKTIQSDVSPLATDAFQGGLAKVSDALQTDPIDATAVATAASEIAVRCALVGVNLEFPNPQDLLVG